MMEELTGYHTTTATRRRRLCCYWWCWWRVACAHLDTKQGRSSTKALNVNVTHIHIVCLVGRVTIERELAVS